MVCSGRHYNVPLLIPARRIELKNRCFVCGREVEPGRNFSLQPGEDGLSQLRKINLCSYEHLQETVLFEQTFREQHKLVFRLGMVSLALYLLVFILLPFKYCKWIYLVFTIDWGIGMIFFPWLWIPLLRWVSLRTYLKLNRIVGILLMISGIVAAVL